MIGRSALYISAVAALSVVLAPRQAEA